MLADGAVYRLLTPGPGFSVPVKQELKHFTRNEETARSKKYKSFHLLLFDVEDKFALNYSVWVLG